MTTAPTKVACVGDSITFGMGIADPAATYPAALGRALGAGFTVRSFGHSGATAQRHGDLPYTAQAVFAESLAWRPDVVVLMLGTNDSKARNWRGAAGFEIDCAALVARYRELPAEVFVALPCPAFAGNDTINDAVLREEIVPSCRRVAAAGGAAVIDVRAALEAHAEFFPDGIHPDARGAALIAAVVKAAVTDRTSRG